MQLSLVLLQLGDQFHNLYWLWGMVCVQLSPPLVCTPTQYPSSCEEAVKIQMLSLG